ncbi:MAM and LDL-receptor class A domain-containing protein 1-like [Antedon mediterranea]|uniref:MAM and LDL-receptor class A domain-containing protein 1-like n=1 Tax=Antedon mediterranea TaxID=105859 RepID=UPI003AF907F1
MTIHIFLLLIISALVSRSSVHCSTDIECSFEEDTCTIQKDHGTTARWIRWSGASAGFVDHTYGNNSGFFMSVHGRGTARLLIEVFDSGPKCLTFWYNMFDQTRYDDGSLRIYQQNDSNIYDEPIWKVTGDFGNDWRPIELDLTSSINNKAIIEAKQPTDSSISIDDIVLTDGRCLGIYSEKPNISCTFEYNSCGYKTDPTVDVEWIRQQAEKGAYGDGPDEDHTLGFDYGHYLCVDPDTTPRYTGQRAIVVSPIHNKTADDYCVFFWYYIFRSRGEMFVLLQQSNQTDIMWNFPGDSNYLPALWREGSFQITNTDDTFRLIFEAIRGEYASQGAFCIDDVDIFNGVCEHTTPTPKKQSEVPWQVKNIEDAGCTFEDNDCGYGPYDEKETSWGIKQGYDHTVGENGHYLGIKYEKSGWAYRTPYIYSNSVSNCLKFNYRCLGDICPEGPLHIHIMDQAIGEEALSVDPFSKVYTRGNTGVKQWKQIQIDLPQTNGNFTVIFELVVETMFKFGIDDVTFYNQECSAVKPEPFISTIDCDFEAEKMCGYSQPGTRKEWIRFQGPTPSLGTGPDNDHTLNTREGHYIYVEASEREREGVFFYIRTPMFRHSNGPMCFRFWYHMQGEHTGDLRIQIQGQTWGYFRREDLWSERSSTSGWTLGTIDLDNERTMYDEHVQIQFVAFIAGGHEGDVALDDITLVDNVCNVPKPAITHSHCQFNSHPNKCNYNDYLPNHTWYPWKHQYASWHIGSTTSIGISKGVNSFLYADIEQENKHVAIVSPNFEYGERYCLQFYYIIKQDFSLNIRSSNQSLLTSLTRQMAPSWAKHSLEWEPLKEDEQFAIMFEAKIGHKRNGFVAIDDISIGKGHCPVPEIVDKIDCNFEKDCDLSTNISLANGWQLSNKETYKHTKLPNIDNTYGTPSGHYYFISFRHTQPPTERNFLRTPVVEMTTNKRCLQFYYYMNSNVISSLNVYIDDASIKHFPVDPIWHSIGKKGNRWNRVQVDIGYTKGNYSIVFEPRSGSEHHVDIAIDDVVLLNKTCIKVIEPKWTSTIDCDFESENICGYKDEHTAKFNWTQIKGKTKTINSGPTQDHTYISEEKEGNYMYIETSNPRIPFDAAELSSPLLPTSADSKCLQFWYHMHGKSIGSLEVYRVTPAINEKMLLWSNTGDQGDNWKKAILPLNVKRYFKNGYKELLNHSMKVHFKGIVGYGHEGDIAIDDVKVVIMSCDPPPDTPPVSAIFCDFENGVKRCGFEENTNEDGSGADDSINVLDWTFFNASTIGNQTISKDTNVVLSQSQSSYIFAKASELQTGQRVVLTSSAISAGLHHCLHYSYVSTGDFIIDIYTKSSSGKVGIVFALPRRHQATWRKRSVNLFPQSETFTIVFEGMVGRERTGLMALDDIMVENGKCTTASAGRPEIKKTTVRPEVTESSSQFTAIVCLSVFFAIVMILLVLLSLYHFKFVKQPKGSDNTNTDDRLIQEEITNKYSTSF